MITEVGGTVGDIESLPFLEAARQVRHDIGRDNCFFLHVSLVPYIGPSGELKTKPTQHSVAALRQVGIQPDAVVCRADRELPDSIKRKISLMCDVDQEAVVTAADAPSIYDIPKVLHREGLDAYVVRRLGLPFRDVDWTVWDDLLRRVHHPKEEVTIALVGKYVDLHDAYLSVAEALRAGGFAHEAEVDIRWIPSDECETQAGASRHLHDVDAICVPGGFGVRGLEGKIGALTYARTNRIPTLGLCLGLQCMVIEYSRNVAGLEKADSTEFDPDSPEPVIATMAEQLAYVEGAGDLGGTMRLGLYPALLKPGSIAREAYGAEQIDERHRHRYEVNNAYRDTLEEAGLVFSGTSPDNNLVEFVELPARPAPLLHLDPGAPRAPLPPDPPAPAVQGAGRCGDRASEGAPLPDRRDRAAPRARRRRRLTMAYAARQPAEYAPPMRRPSYASVVATLALVVALGGTSYAAVKITGKDVKNGSLSGKDVKDESLTGKDAQEAVRAARPAEREPAHALDPGQFVPAAGLYTVSAGPGAWQADGTGLVASRYRRPVEVDDGLRHGRGHARPRAPDDDRREADAAARRDGLLGRHAEC